MSQLRTYFLGPFRVTRNDKSITGFESDKMRALLAYLVIEADHAHRREELAALLWPDQAETAARQSLRQALYILQKALSDDREEPNAESSSGATASLLVTRQTVQLNPAGDISSDVRHFTDLLAACKAHKHPPSEYADPRRCVECIGRLKSATELYKGDFLQGFVVNDSREFEEWMLLERETHHRQMMHALEQLGDYHEEIGENEQSLQFVLWQLKLEPWREEAHRQAMRLLSRTGQRSAALVQYETCRQVLAEELGLEPARETTALYERIRDAENENQAERELPVAGTTNLPSASTPLIGREAEITAVVEQLLREDVRLLTLTGPGGVGKTRIALQAGTDLQRHFADGACFINLAPIIDPGLVAFEIAGALGVKDKPDKTTLEGLISYLQGKRMLLLLDNFEQIAEAAPLVARLVQQSPSIKVLVTSRISLGLRGTKEFPVPPLSMPARKQLPPFERLTGYEAIRLFVERASALKPSFAINKENAQAIVEICRRLDGLPLAIELVAARIKVLSPHAMLERLQSSLSLVTGKDRDVPTRQQTLRNTLDWSYNLLDSSEKTLFRRMSTFKGGRTLSAIQSICAGVSTSLLSQAALLPALQEQDLLDEVESLVSKSLLQHVEGYDDEPRFWMLETIHEYAREKLGESGEEDELRRRHARYFLELVEEAEPHLKQQDQAVWLGRLEDEHDNIRAAFRWARECGKAGDSEAAELGLRLAIALVRFWEVRVHLREGLEQTLGVLAIGRPQGKLRAQALNVAAGLAEVCGDFPATLSMLTESLEIWQGTGEKNYLLDTLHALGLAYYTMGDFVRAGSYLEHSLQLEQELGVHESSRHNLALVLYEQGDYESAYSMLEDYLAKVRAIGDTRIVALTLANMGLAAYEQGKYVQALSIQKESLGLRVAIGAKLGIAYSLEGMAMVYRGLGSTEKAARLWGAAQAMREAMGAPIPPNERERYKREQDLLSEQLGEEGFQQAFAQGGEMSPEEAAELALQ